MITILKSSTPTNVVGYNNGTYEFVENKTGDFYVNVIKTDNSVIEIGDKVILRDDILTVSEFTHDNTVCFEEETGYDEITEDHFIILAKKIVASNSNLLTPKNLLLKDELVEILEKEDVKKYSTKEVKNLFKNLFKNSSFVEFHKDYGISGWDELEKWLEINIK